MSSAASGRGAVAWRATHLWRHPNLGTSQEIVVADSHGKRVADSGEPGSLEGPAFAGALKLTWTHDGAARSAQAYAGLPRD